MIRARLAPPLALLVALSCGSDGDGARALPGVVPSMDFSEAASFFAAPFPSEHRRRDDGGVDVGTFPNPAGVGIVEQARALLTEDARGFGRTSGAFFRMSDALDPARLPASPADSLAEGAALVWADVDPASPERGRRIPFHSAYVEDPGPHGEPRLLVLVPYQGVPLRAGTRYAVAIRRELGDANGAPLGQPLEMAELARGRRPAAMGPAAFAEYDAGLRELRAQGVEPRTLAGVAVFRTDDPTRGMRALAEHVETLALPALEVPWTTVDRFDDYCVLASEIRMPVFQEGRPPFLSGGGRVRFDAAGRPIAQGTEASRLFVTVPRRAPRGPAGFPYVVFLRSGGGGDRPLVDRGRRAEPGGVAVEPGEGPARYFARAGWAAITFDGPHGGPRNVSGLDEQLTIFNFLNPGALRDNLRENATESVLVARLAATLALDPALCPEAGPAPIRLDPGDVALMGHSIGATTAPLALATSARFTAGILSGAGGSYIENVLFKQSPVPVKPIAELILGYPGQRRSLTRFDPFLNLLQWAAEPADPPVYDAAIVDEPTVGAPRDVLMFQGIEDTYITPTIANATTASIRLDLGGAVLDGSVLEALALGGSERVELPASANRATDAGPRTAVLVQHVEDPVEDGHEIVFQLDAPKRQYRCFLETLAATGTAVVPPPDGPCP